MLNFDINVDRQTEGKSDALYRTLLQAGAIKRFCAMKYRTIMTWIPPPARLEPETQCSEVMSANHSADQMLHQKKNLYSPRNRQFQINTEITLVVIFADTKSSG